MSTQSLGVATLDLRADASNLKTALRSSEREVDKAAAGMGKKLEQIGDRLQTVGKNATKYLTVPLAGAAAVSLKLASDVDKGLREVNTLFGLTGAESEKNFKSMQKDLADWSKQMGISQRVGVKGLYQAISAGVPKENVFEFMTTAGKAAIAGNTDVETSIDGITTYLNAFGLEADQAQAVADSMFQAVKDGKTTFDEIASAAFNVAPAAAAAGVSFQEVNAAISTLTASGTPTSVATTQMRAALDGLQKPSEDLDKIFQDLGYANAQVAIESKGLGFALDAVKKASKGNNGELQKLLGSSEAVAAANVLAGTSSEKFAKDLDNQRKSAGNVDTAFAEMEKSTARQMERLKVGLENLGISIGNILLPWLNKLVGVGQKVTGWLNGMSDGQRQVVVGVGLFVAALGPALIITGKFVSALGAAAQNLKLAAAAKWIAAKAQAAYNAVLNANPIMRVVTVLSLLAAGLVVAYKHSETFRAVVHAALAGVVAAAEWLWAAINKAWNDIKAGTAALWAEIKRAGGGIMSVVRSIGDAATWLWRTIIVPAWNGITTATGAMWSAVKAYFDLWKSLIETVGRTASWLWTNAVKPAWDGIRAGTSALWAAVQQIFGFFERGVRNLGTTAAWLWANAIRPAWDGITAGTRALWGNVISPIAGFITRAFDRIGNAAGAMKGAVQGAFDFIRERVVDPAYNTFKRIANGFITVVHKVFQGAEAIAGAISRIPGVDIKFSIPRIPMLADGDIIRRPTLAVVGEDGPEAVIPLGAKRRRRGQQLMTRAALMMGMPGVDPSSGMKFMADGGIVAPGPSVADLEANIARYARGDGGGGNLFKRAFDVLKDGLSAFLLRIPRLNLGDGPWADAMSGLPGWLWDKVKGMATSLFRAAENSFGTLDIMRAKHLSESIMGRPYGWGAGRPPGWNHGSYDCSGYASTAWWEASGKRGGSGTTMSLFPISKRARGDEPFQFVFRGMSSNDPRQQHMGTRILGDEYDFGNPGMKNRGRPWDHAMVPPYVPGFAAGTDRITREGLAYLHRDEAVVPAAENMRGRRRALFGKLAEQVHFHEPSDADRILGDLGNRFALRAGALA